MNISLNGTTVQTQAQTVAQLLESLQISPIGVAVAVNDQVVRRTQHAEFAVSEGDRIEIIRAVQGG
ncbi:MAG TPA: sulfur carrier protein ThiS [Abditibacterium sp.]|jgi:sulfur carrier protein